MKSTIIILSLLVATILSAYSSTKETPIEEIISLVPEDIKVANPVNFGIVFQIII